MNRAEIKRRVKELPFDPNAFWVVAGAAAVLYGVRDETGDLDLGCTTELADRLDREGIECRRSGDGTRAFKIGEDLELFEHWLYDRVVMLDEIPVISLPGLLTMKERLGRPKDRSDVERIKTLLEEKKKG